MKASNQHSILSSLKDLKSEEKHQLAVLLDPDKVDRVQLFDQVAFVGESGADMILVGGSLLLHHQTDEIIRDLKRMTDLPVVIFPGSPMQMSAAADALLFLSLISGRNPELLIGHHVRSAPLLKKMEIEVISSGYMLVDGGKPTTVSYITQTAPIPHDKAQIALCTALAGEMLGLRTLYLDSGSGAIWPVHPEMIAAVSKGTDLPLIVGGGINSAEKAFQAAQAGAELIVVGTAFEQQPELLKEMSNAVHSCNTIAS